MILLSYVFVFMAVAGPTAEQRAAAIRVLQDPNLQMDLLAAFDTEKIMGHQYGQARAAAAKSFLVNRGLDPSLIQIRHTGVSEAFPFLVFPSFAEDGTSLYFFPSSAEQFLRDKTKPFAFLPVYGSLDQVAQEVSLVNDTTPEMERRKIDLIVDGASIADMSRFDGSFKHLGKSITQRVREVVRGGVQLSSDFLKRCLKSLK